MRAAAHHFARVVVLPARRMCISTLARSRPARGNLSRPRPARSANERRLVVGAK
jgi:hypothetical protein